MSEYRYPSDDRYSPGEDRHYHPGEDFDCWCDGSNSMSEAEWVEREEGEDDLDARGRLRFLDAARGLAVLLMVLDHALVQVAPGHLLRYTVTRLSLPLFMAVAAFSHANFGRGLSSRRARQLAAAVAVECVLLSVIGMAQPGPVALAAMVLVLFSVTGHRLYPYSGALAVLGLLQAAYLPITWPGYQPGTVLAYFCVGLLASYQLEELWKRLPRWLGVVGRRPLLWYCGHLLVLAVVVRAVLL